MTPKVERFIEAVESHTGHRREQGGDGYKLWCPSHEGHSSALSVSEGRDGKPLLHCHFGCKNNDVLAAVGWKWTDFHVGEPQFGKPRNAKIVHPSEIPGPPIKCQSISEFCEERLLDAALLSKTWRVTETRHKGRPCLRYQTRLKVDRVKFLDGKKPKYEWVAKGGVAHWYGMGAAKKIGGPTLFVVNGEPSVWACHQEGVPAVCPCSGEGKRIGEELIGSLVESGFKSFRIVYDLDEKGRGGARGAVAALRDAGLEAEALELPADLGAKADVDDLHRRERANLRNALDHLAELPEDEKEVTRVDPLASLNALQEGATLQEVEIALKALTDGAGSLAGVALEMVREGAIRRLKILKLNSPARMVDAALPPPKADSPSSAVTLAFNDPPLWPEPVDGAGLANDMDRLFRKYLVLADGAPETFALWALMAHAEAAFDLMPMLALTSPEMQCGKSTALTLLGSVVPKPLSSANISPAAVYRIIEKWHPTLMLDEAETYVRPENEALRGVLNSGHSRAQAFVIRVEGESLEPRRYSTWGPKIFALIGKLPATLEDRSITITMKRKARGEAVERLRLDQLPAVTEHLRRRAARWAIDNTAALKGADPDIPPELVRDRTRDNWRTLLAIADLIGGEWPSRARGAALALAAGRPGEDTHRIVLLEDIRAVFDEGEGERLRSEALVKSLVEMEGHPWPEWRDGHPLTATQLARLLKPFDIKPEKWKGGDGKTRRGYHRALFDDAFSRYLGEVATAEAPPGQPATPATALIIKHLGKNENATETDLVAGVKIAKSLEMRAVALVADEVLPPGVGEV